MPVHADEALVDAVDLLLGPEPSGDRRHPVAHVAVEREVGRQGDDAGVRQLADWISNQGAPMAMPRALASLLLAIAQPSLLLSTITGRPSRLGRNDPLAAHIEVVAVDQGEHDFMSRSA